LLKNDDAIEKWEFVCTKALPVSKKSPIKGLETKLKSVESFPVSVWHLKSGFIILYMYLHFVPSPSGKIPVALYYKDPLVT
jgi:hypothetical protein